MGLFNYWVAAGLIVTGLYVVMAETNLMKKLLGISIFQAAVFIFYITIGKLAGGTAPILADAHTLYANPLPHVLILTAIVVGVATLALAAALLVRIYGAYGTLEEDEIDDQERGG